MSQTESSFRAGLIALVGLPNAGKSTLMNSILGEKVAIVSHRPQTTRNAIYGIKTTKEYQAIFVDTPGFHTPKTKFNQIIVQEAIDSLSIVDVICLVFEAGSKFGKDFERLLELIKNAPQEKVLIITKVDKVPKEEVYKAAEAVFPLCEFKHVLPVSAIKNTNVSTLMELLKEMLPENVLQYDEDLITTQPQNFLISEYIREQIFLRLRSEVPYNILVQVEECEETEKSIEVSAVIYVARDSQKGIVIGENGSMIEKIGTAARKNIATFFSKKTHLHLFVKVKQNWFAKCNFD